jgi:hypothetical protein
VNHPIERIDMARFDDQFKATTRADLCGYRRQETAERRHDRRFSTAQATAELARQFCEERGIKMTVSNHGHHFIFRLADDHPKRHFAQWWPRTAKLVFFSRWEHGIHAHDIGQVIEEMRKVLDGECRKEHVRHAHDKVVGRPGE